MDFAKPYSVVCPTLDGPVLHILYHTTRPLTGREVSRLVTRGSERGVRLVLGRLVSHGLVNKEPAGAASLYTLNREHLAFPIVGQLMSLLEELPRRISEAIATWPIPPNHASLFGSAARGDGNLTSDVDIFMIRQNDVASDDIRWRRQLQGLADQIHDWTGNHASLIEVSRAELKAMLRRNEPIAESLRKESVRLYGDHFQALGIREMAQGRRK
ncbi:MAG: nucleotidyltransferase domain-containing protein [Candidatus Dormibacteraceae bacterium]